MALRADFDAMKFWEQCKATALRYRKTEEQAEDFASFCVEKVLHYQHFQPMSWLLSTFFGASKYNRTSKGEEGYHERYCTHFEDFKSKDESEMSTDHLECLSVDHDFDSALQEEQCKSLALPDISKSCLDRARSAIAARRSWALKKKLDRLNISEVRDFIEHMKPLEINWIKI